VLNQSLGLLLPDLPIEIHRFELRVVAKPGSATDRHDPETPGGCIDDVYLLRQNQL